MKTGLAFTSEQRGKLTREKRLTEEIAELQRLLPRIRDWQHKPPPRADVRDHIQTVSEPLQQAMMALRELEAAAFPDDGPEGPAIDRMVSPQFRRESARALPALDALEAYTRLVPPGDEPNVETMLAELVAQVADIERQIMASGQNYPAAPWRPIELIKEALYEGWAKHHNARGRGLVRHGDDHGPASAFPPYDGPTVSPAGRFGRIARICYQAAGIYSSPERAIRAYQAREDWRKHRRIEERRKENLTLPPDEQYRAVDLTVAPRARGRPANKK